MNSTWVRVAINRGSRLSCSSLLIAGSKNKGDIANPDFRVVVEFRRLMNAVDCSGTCRFGSPDPQRNIGHPLIDHLSMLTTDRRIIDVDITIGVSSNDHRIVGEWIFFFFKTELSVEVRIAIYAANSMGRFCGCRSVRQ